MEVVERGREGVVGVGLREMSWGLCVSECYGSKEGLFEVRKRSCDVRLWCGWIWKEG